LELWSLLDSRHPLVHLNGAHAPKESDVHVFLSLREQGFERGQIAARGSVKTNNGDTNDIGVPTDPVVILGLTLDKPLDGDPVVDANRTVLTPFSHSLIDRNDSLGGHNSVDEVRFGPSSPNATPCPKSERHADDDALVIIGPLVVGDSVVRVGKPPGSPIPGMGRARVRKHSAHVQTSSSNASTDREVSSMVKEADVESVPKRNPTHSFRNHSLSQPSASAVPDLRSTRKNTTSPHEHINALLGIVTARKCDSEKSSDASAVGGGRR
jgi:hypothetical protein